MQSSADCTSPDPNTTLPGVCITTPFNAKECYFQQSTQLFVDGVWGANAYDGAVDISGGLASWGDSDGGINAAFLDISHGTKPHMWQYQLGSAMAGIHVVGTIMPIWGDTNIVADRGQTFGDFFVVNPRSSVAYSWTNTLSLLPVEAGGSPCSTTSDDYSLGGGQGINGCGCNLVISQDATLEAARAHMTEDWRSIADDSLDARGNTWFRVHATCNFDVVQHPFSN